MLREFQLDMANPEQACRELTDAWKDPSAKVFVLRAPKGGVGEVKSFYEGLFPVLGRPATLAEDVTIGGRDNQRTGQIWTEVRYDPKFPDAYRHSANAQPLHTDGSYIPNFPNATLLACVVNADEGGETTFIDSPHVVEALQTENPSLFEFLSTVDVPHERTGDRRVSKILYQEDGLWHLNWNYYCVDPKIEPEKKAKVEAFFAFLQSSPLIAHYTVPVKLGPGDGVTWKDDEVLHGRNSFKAQNASERFIWKCAIDIGVVEVLA